MFEITGVRLKRGCTKLHISYVSYVVLQQYLLNYSAQNESESRSRDRCFLFFVLSCVTYYGLFYVVLACGPPVESVPGPTRCCCDHSLQTWRSLKHECEHNPLCIVYVLGHPTIHSIAPLDLYCAIGVVLRNCFWILFEFQVIRKVVKDLAMIRDLMRRVCVTVTEIQT